MRSQGDSPPRETAGDSPPRNRRGQSPAVLEKGVEMKRSFVGLSIILALSFPGAVASISHFETGAVAVIKEDEKSLFDFSADGTHIWVVSRDAVVTNCYALSGEKVRDSEMQSISPPLERLSWMLKMPNWHGHNIKLIRDDSDNRILPEAREVEFRTGEDAQLYPYGEPRVTGQIGNWKNWQYFIYQTDCRSFTIERMLSVDDDARVSPHSVYLSKSGANVLMDLHNLGDEYPNSLYLYSGDFGQIDKELLSKMKKFSMKDMRRLTDDAKVYNLWGVFLSENIAAIVASSAYSRTSFKGRCYVFLYDFRSGEIFWQRKSSREFPWNGFVAVCWCDIVLSQDEQFLAVMSGGKIYIYRMKYSESE